MLEGVVRKDAEGVEEHLGYLTTPRGELYTYFARPPHARSCVVICSSVFGDFTANYHRERLLARGLVSHGIGVFRFHYFGEGNSQGQRADMTFSSLCSDAEAVIALATSFGFSDIAVLGTRVGGLVAAESVKSTPRIPLALWEPVIDPNRFVNDALRAMKMSQMAQRNVQTIDLREQLLRTGFIDLLGYELHSRLVESLERVDLLTALGHGHREIFLGRFSALTDRSDRLADTLIQRGFGVTLEDFGLSESWWFHSERLPEIGDLITATTGWLAGLTWAGR